jgi:hypothetical protein
MGYSPLFLNNPAAPRSLALVSITVEFQGLRIGAPERSRTPNLLIRSQALYPVELRALAEPRGREQLLYGVG